MADNDQLPPPAGTAGADTPNPEPDTPDDGDEPGDGGDASDDGGEDSAEGGLAALVDDDLVEVKVGDKAYKIPRAVRPLMEMQADYTRKTQEVAEARKAIETERAQLPKMRESVQADIDGFLQLRQMDVQLGELSKVNWSQAEAEADAIQDPDERTRMLNLVQRREREFQRLTQSRSSLAGTLYQREQERASTAAAETAKQQEQARQSLVSPDPATGWPGLDDKVGPELHRTAKALGVSDEDFAAITKPEHFKILHLASIGLKTLRSAQKPVKRPSLAAVPEPAPTRTVAGRGGGNPNVPRDSDDPETWNRKRNEQRRAAGKR